MNHPFIQACIPKSFVKNDTPLTKSSFVGLGQSILSSPTFQTLVSGTALFGGGYYIIPISPISLLSASVGLIGLKSLYSMATTHKSKIYHELALTGLHLLTIFKPNNLNWWDSITDSIILGALPLTSDHCNKIAMQANAILSIVEKLELRGIGFFADPITEKDWKEKNMEQKIISVVDRAAPSQEQIKEGVEFIYQNVLNRQKIYVHCKAGKGRSATVVICYLIHHQKLTFNDAFNFVKKCRPVVNLTYCQIKAAKEYEQTLNI